MKENIRNLLARLKKDDETKYQLLLYSIDDNFSDSVFQLIEKKYETISKMSTPAFNIICDFILANAEPEWFIFIFNRDIELQENYTLYLQELYFLFKKGASLNEITNYSDLNHVELHKVSSMILKKEPLSTSQPSSTKSENIHYTELLKKIYDLIKPYVEEL